MKKLIIIILFSIGLSSCRGCFADFEERRIGVKKVCPTCTFVKSEDFFYASDTSKQPNIIYRVYFKEGGMYYTASTVDHLVRIN